MSSKPSRKSREKSPPCGCGEIERHVAEAYFPIIRDEQTGVYSLLSCDSRWSTPLKYCFACGGRLPVGEE